MFQRLVIAYAAFTVGVTLISFAMMAQGIAQPWNPAWPFVSGVRNFCLLSWLIVGGGAALISYLDEPDPQRTLVVGPSPEEIAAYNETNRVSQEEQEEIRLARETEARREAERKAKEQEEAQQRQEKLKRQVEEKRKNRTAEDAARSGLDDFL